MSIRGVIASHVSHLFSDGGGDDDMDADEQDNGIDDIDLVDEIADELDFADDNEWQADDVGESYDENDEDEDGESTNRSSFASASTADTRQYNAEDLAILKQLRDSLPDVDGSATIAQHRKKSKNVNFGINAVLDKIDVPLYSPTDWLWRRDAALTVADEDSRTKQYILHLTGANTRTLPPQRGTQRRITPPTSLGDVTFEKWMLLSTPKLYTTNVVSTFHLGSPVSLFYLVHRTLGVCFNPRCFAAAKLRCTKGTHLIFSGGSVVCAGANSVQTSRIAARDCTLLLTRVGIQAEVSKFVVQNVVSTADAGFQVHLFELARAYPINAHFDPECFPGLMFRLSTSQLVFIVFESGKCIITGVSSRAQSLVAWRWFHSRVLWEFEKQGTIHESAADYHRQRRQQSSMIASMCESVRDITTANLALRLGAEKEPLMEAHFNDLQRAGGALSGGGGTERIDLEQWIELFDFGSSV